MTFAERQQRGTSLCRRLSEVVTDIVPIGIGGWDPAWEMVAEADADFLAALTAWEAEPTDEGRARVQTAYHAVVDAWKDAALQFERARAER